MPTRQNDVQKLHGMRGLPQPVTGAPSTLFEAEVTVIHATTLDARPLSRRGAQINARFPLWYIPAKGDRVIIADLQGDERMRIVLQVICTASGGAPAHT